MVEEELLIVEDRTEDEEVMVENVEEPLED